MDKKKKHSKKGIAIITVLGVCFVLLALGSVLMADSCAHMKISQKYYYEALALHLAEGGVSKTIFELEKYSKLSEIPDYLDPNTNSALAGYLGEGRFEVEAYNNINSSGEKTVSGHIIPPYSILILSHGIIGEAGKEEYKKTIETIVNYQLIPYTMSSEGKVRINVGVGESPEAGETGDPWAPGAPQKSDLETFSASMTAIDGFIGNIHSNFSGSTGNSSFRGSTDLSVKATLDIAGSTFSTSGKIGDEATDAITDSHGIAEDDTSDKEFAKTSYSSLHSMAQKNGAFISLDQNVPGIADFKGKMKNDGGTLKGFVDIEILGIEITDEWVDIENVPIYGNCLPDGMHWESGTGTLVIEENRNYDWGGSLSLEDINIRVDGTESSSLFVAEDIYSTDITITGDAFSLVSDEDITLKNAVINVTAPQQSNGVAVYAKNFTLTTDPDPNHLPDGGNKFKGMVYIKDGEINIINQCGVSSDPDKPNKFSLEGLVINDISDSNINPATGLPYSDNIGLNLYNTGGTDFAMELKYNPYVANSMVDYTNAAVHLQPLYWKID